MKNYKGHTLLIVAEILHKDNWQKEFDKWNFKGDVTIECYASLKKHIGEKWDTIILDEAHHTFTDKRINVLTSMRYDNIVLLSSTLSYNQMQAAENIWGKFEVSTITLKDATDEGALPEPEINVIYFDLDDTNKCYEYQMGKKKIMVTQKKYYDLIDDKYEYYKERFDAYQDNGNKIQMLRAAGERKKFIGSIKESLARDLCQKLDKKGIRYICFCTNIEQAISLGGDRQISSKNTPGKNRFIMNEFDTHKINSLYVVSMANEGMNLKDIERAVIVQLDGTVRLFIQKFGRSMRATKPIQYILCCNQTQDVKYFQRIAKEVDENHIHLYKVDEYLNSDII